MESSPSKGITLRISTEFDSDDALAAEVYAITSPSVTPRDHRQRFTPTIALTCTTDGERGTPRILKSESRRKLACQLIEEYPAPQRALRKIRSIGRGMSGRITEHLRQAPFTPPPALVLDPLLMAGSSSSSTAVAAGGAIGGGGGCGSNCRTMLATAVRRASKSVLLTSAMAEKGSSDKGIRRRFHTTPRPEIPSSAVESLSARFLEAAGVAEDRRQCFRVSRRVTSRTGIEAPF